MYPLWVKSRDWGKVMVLRLRRPRKYGRTQANSTHTYLESDVAIPLISTSNSSQGLDSVEIHPQSSTNASPTESSWRALLSREASDITQLSLPVVQAAVEAIPLAGAPMKAVIGALLAILQL
jgi:hypothetical protein